MMFNCVITDDEPIALEIIENHLRLVPGFNVVAKCKSAMETYTVLQQEQVDVLFMDIQMPGITGLELIRSLKCTPAIVFTTAYPNYAIDGFEADAIDYLLKPISLERFLKTVDKIVTRSLSKESRHESNQFQQANDRNFFFIKTDQDLVKLEFDKILYIEGLENYVKIHSENKVYVFHSTMKQMEDIFSSRNFLRIHRSFIVNLAKVDSIQNHSFIIGGKELITSRSYRKSVTEVIKNYYSI